MIATHTRIADNLAILQHLKQGGEAANHALKHYSGWGGLQNALQEPVVYQTLASLLTETELKTLKRTLKNAYYTPPFLVDFIYQWLGIYGFQGGNILEPSVGHGVFIEAMPDAWRSKSDIAAVELDCVTADIARKLYPDVTVHQQGFEHFQPQARYDLIIGNPPYGAEKVHDAAHPDLSRHAIHHYFLAKCARLLKPKGVLAMVLPLNILDNSGDHVRSLLIQEGVQLIDGYRLPDDLFTDAKVTVDILFFKKGGTPRAWCEVKRIKINGDATRINQFFYDHPEKILGQLEMVNAYERKLLTCRPFGNLEQRLQQALAAFRMRKQCFEMQRIMKM